MEDARRLQQGDVGEGALVVDGVQGCTPVPRLVQVGRDQALHDRDEPLIARRGVHARDSAHAQSQRPRGPTRHPQLRIAGSSTRVW